MVLKRCVFGNLCARVELTTVQRRQVEKDVQLDENSPEPDEDSNSEGSDGAGDGDIMDLTGFDGEKSARTGKKGKSAIPRGEEIRAIKEGEELFKSNTFKLQVNRSYVLFCTVLKPISARSNRCSRASASR